MNLDELEPPDRPDFRRIGRGIPYVMGLHGKRERYRRSSGAGKILDDESGLTDWRVRTVVVGAAQRPDLMAQVSTCDPERDKKEIRDIAEQCLVSGKGTQRANMGTAIHRMLDHVDLNDDWTAAPQYVDTIDAYLGLLDAYGLVPVDVEVHCVNDGHRLAGTMDRRYRTTRVLIAPDGRIIPIGSVIVGDTKTGKSLEYVAGTYATQIAAYVDSVRYDVTTDERTPFDPPNYYEWGIIIHVVADEGRCDLYWVDLNAGRMGLRLAHDVHDWRRHPGLILPGTAPMAEVDDSALASHPANGANPPAISPVAGATGAGDATALPDVRAWLRERIAVVRKADESASRMLIRTWPMGVAGLKFDTQTAAELDAIGKALDAVEAQFSLPFPSSDPRMPTLDERDHPRRELIAEWLAMLGPLGTNMQLWATAKALQQFATVLSVEDFTDEETTELLLGTLNTLGYDGMAAITTNGSSHDAWHIVATAEAIASGHAMLLLDEAGKPFVRTIEITNTEESNEYQR